MQGDRCARNTLMSLILANVARWKQSWRWNDGLRPILYGAGRYFCVRNWQVERIRHELATTNAWWAMRMNRVSYSIHHAHNGISFFKSDERARAGENKAADVFGREKSHSLENNNNPPIHHVVLFLRFTTLDLFNDFERPLLLFLLLWVWVWIRIWWSLIIIVFNFFSFHDIEYNYILSTE